MEILCPVNVHTCVRDEHCQYSFQVELQVDSSQSHGPSPVALESHGQEATVSLQLCQREKWQGCSCSWGCTLLLPVNTTVLKEAKALTLSSDPRAFGIGWPWFKTQLCCCFLIWHLPQSPQSPQSLPVIVGRWKVSAPEAWHKARGRECTWCEAQLWVRHLLHRKHCRPWYLLWLGSLRLWTQTCAVDVWKGIVVWPWTPHYYVWPWISSSVKVLSNLY